MVAQVNAYLADRTLDAAGRRKVVLDQCQFTDGGAAARIAACVAEELSETRQVAPGTVGAPQLS